MSSPIITTTARPRTSRRGAILLVLALVLGAAPLSSGAATAAPQVAQEPGTPTARLGAWVSPQGDRNEIHHGATMLDGQLWTITSTGAIAWDVTDPLDPTVTTSIEEPGTGELGAMERAAGAGDVVAVAAWTRNVEIPGTGYGVQNRPDLEECDDTTCRLTLIEDGEVVQTAPFHGTNLACLQPARPGRGRGGRPAHAGEGRPAHPPGRVMDDCTWMWSNTGHIYQRTRDGLVIREERWRDAIDTEEQPLGDVFQLSRLAPDIVAIAEYGVTPTASTGPGQPRDVLVLDTSDPLAPRRLHAVTLDLHGKEVASMSPVPGTTEAFAGTRGDRNEITAEQRRYCNGLNWFDWQTGASTSWSPDTLPISPGAKANTCHVSISPHPDFVSTRLIAASLLHSGVALIHVSEAGEFTLLDHLPVPVGTPMDVAWTGDDTLAVAAYDGGLFVTRVSTDHEPSVMQ